MYKSLVYLLSKGVVTSRTFCPPLEEGVRGLPSVTAADCTDAQCRICADLCPTDAIAVNQQDKVTIDLGACIACGLCTQNCPSGTIVNDTSTMTARNARQDLVIAKPGSKSDVAIASPSPGNIFGKSIAIRVVSTGCSACDLEIGACGNPIFDMERFGVHVVASPRFADVLMVTGPVPKAMHEPLRRCYDAMAEPRLVMAVGTCAISGGVHKGGYTEANGTDSIIPVDVYVPGCPPTPWSIIHGVQQAMSGKRKKA